MHFACNTIVHYRIPIHSSTFSPFCLSLLIRSHMVLDKHCARLNKSPINYLNDFSTPGKLFSPFNRFCFPLGFSSERFLLVLGSTTFHFGTILVPQRWIIRNTCALYARRLSDKPYVKQSHDLKVCQWSFQFFHIRRSCIIRTNMSWTRQ